MIQPRKSLLLLLGTAIGVSLFAIGADAQDPYCAPTNIYMYNQVIGNTTTCTVNDYHARFTVNSPGTICVTAVDMSAAPEGNFAFTYGSFTANSPSNNDVTISWRGPTNQPFGIPPGAYTHIGANILLPSGTNGFAQTEGWWTVDGMQGCGSVPAPTPVWQYGNFNLFTIAQIKMYSDASGSNQIGTQWAEGNGSLLNVINATHTPVFANWATFTSATLVPLGDLNSSLTGFGPFNQIVELKSVNPCLLNCGPPQQNSFFNDLGSGSNVYQANSGLLVSGSGAPSGTSYTQANLFTSAASGSISQIDVGVGYVSGVNSFYVALYTDNNSLPGTQLGQWSNLSSDQSFGGCCALVDITGITGISLTAGQSYFMIVGPMSINSSTSEMWNLNSTGAMGLDLSSTDGGQTWSSNGQQTLGAFDVLGGSARGSLVKR